eukprot:SAG31_NODE_2101_length_6445_cov_16.552159_5_plen_174_part_00
MTERALSASSSSLFFEAFVISEIVSAWPAIFACAVPRAYVRGTAAKKTSSFFALVPDFRTQTITAVPVQSWYKFKRQPKSKKTTAVAAAIRRQGANGKGELPSQRIYKVAQGLTFSAADKKSGKGFIDLKKKFATLETSNSAGGSRWARDSMGGSDESDDEAVNLKGIGASLF